MNQHDINSDCDELSIRINATAAARYDVGRVDDVRPASWMTFDRIAARAAAVGGRPMPTAKLHWHRTQSTSAPAELFFSLFVSRAYKARMQLYGMVAAIDGLSR